MRDPLAIATLRGLALDMPRRAGSGHTGTALSLAPLGWLLYSRILNHRPNEPHWPDRDRFCLSNGHACVLLYGLLYLTGYDLTLDELRRFRQPLSLTPGHPESWVTRGVDVSTGPLGQGFATAVGMAVAARHLEKQHRVYVICSDGDLMEGITAEASSFAGHERLSNLIVYYDDNDVTIDGPVHKSCSDDVPMRYRSYGWHVIENVEGEDLEALERATREAQQQSRPTLIQVKTVIGFPSPGMQGKPEAHSPPFSAEEIRATKLKIGLDPDQEFQILIDVPVYEHKIHPKKAGLEFQPPVFQKSMATRVASGEVLKLLPDLLGGSADLAGSTNVPARLSFGVREHAMAAICNGIVQHGELRAYCSTYFSFSDYMKPALRMAALAQIPTIFVWTHDSLALGEDGPTHQPVEHLAALRALPNFLVIRPADPNETAEAWQIALRQNLRPTGIVLTRQAVPCLKPSGQVHKGAYVLEEGSDVTLIGTGSEVHLCLEARKKLAKDGIQARVVSMPCWELFWEQPEEYRSEVLGDRPRVSVEAASTLGWHRWADCVIGLDRFGGSGPGDRLMTGFGFHVDNVVAKALSCLDTPQPRVQPPARH